MANSPAAAWDVALLSLYAPGLWTVYDIHADGGETIDSIVIDVPCFEDSNGDCIPAGSPCIVSVFSDPPLGLAAVGRIVQTGTAETILADVAVDGDLGAVTVEAIGNLIVGRDLTGPVRATTGNNPVRGVSYIETQGDVLGDVTADHGRIIFILANGRIGSEAAPVKIHAKHDIVQVASWGGIYADIDTRVNGGSGRIFSLGGPVFVGTLNTAALFPNPWTQWPGRVWIWERFEGLLSFGAPLDDPAQWLELPPAGLAGQVIINADGLPNGAWTSPVYLGAEDDPDRLLLDAPRYPETPK